MAAPPQASVTIRGVIAWAGLLAIYGGVLALQSILAMVRLMAQRIGRQPSISCSNVGAAESKVHGADLICIGTFYNEGWLVSHAEPMLDSEAVASVTVVTDHPLSEMPGVRYRCPSERMTRLLGRPISRSIIACSAGRSLRNPVFVGYHIMPNALIALLCGRLLGAPSVYQMTGGAVQVAGGGYESENRLLAMLGRSSTLLERLSFRIVRCFDVVLVRGDSAKRYVDQTIGHPHCHVLTGSVDLQRFADGAQQQPDQQRDIDVLAVGRLAAVKGMEKLVAATAEIQPDQPTFTVTLVGDGPLRATLERQAHSLGLNDSLRFAGASNAVEDYLHRSRLFVLPSITEGLSIAMLEAMAAGVPVVVTDVGELRSVVDAAQCGVVLDDFEASTLASAIQGALADEPRRLQWSRNASQYAATHFSTAAVAAKWSQILSWNTCQKSAIGAVRRSGNA